MKKYLVSLLALAVLLVLGVAPSQATPTAVFVDFSFRNIINGLNTSGIGTVTQGSTLWDVYGADSSLSDTGSMQITGGTITFSSGGNVTFTGTIVGGGSFALTGHVSGFSYDTSGAFPVWNWGTMTWDNLTALNYGTFETFSSPYTGSFSVETTSVGTKIRYVASGTFSPVPIPSSLLLLAPSALGMMVMMRKKRKK